ncbi:MAG: hypothetical protein K2V38_12190, partial [Gemmataceae bacterium]|nr:hypothetical protein [Gemmataceae bacterium]
DVLRQVQGRRPTAWERTWLLSAPDVRAPKGLAWRLVVEAVPGPSGSVSPDWWKFGLLPCPTTRTRSEWFIPAMQAAIADVTRQRPECRLCWHLEPAGQPSQWWLGLWGDSGTAAAGVVAHALFERLADEHPLPDDESYLNPGLAITAAARGAALASVARESLPAKLRTAQEGVDVAEVLVATGQDVSNEARAVGVRISHAASVQEAYDLMRGMEAVFDNYRNAQRREFEYHPADTP